MLERQFDFAVEEKKERQMESKLRNCVIGYIAVAIPANAWIISELYKSGAFDFSLKYLGFM